MERKTRTDAVSWIFSLSAFFLLAIFLFESIVIKSAGQATSPLSVASLLIVFIITTRKDTIKNNLSLSPVLLMNLFLAIWYLIMSRYSLIKDEDGAWLRTVLYIVMVSTAFWTGVALSSRTVSRMFLLSVSFATLFFATIWVMRFNEGSEYGVAATKNVVIGVIAHWVFIISFLARLEKRFVYSCILVMICAILTSQRIFIPGAVIAIAVYFWLSYRGANELRILIVLSLLIIGLVLFVSTISQLNYNPSFQVLNEIVTRYTGRRLNSGREELWFNIFNYLSVSPWVGLGTGVVPSLIFKTGYSAHNSFIQVALQVGVIGVVILTAQLILVCLLYRKSNDTKVGAAAVSYFVFACIHASTEAFLTTNSFVLGATVWLAFGILAERCNEQCSQTAIQGQNSPGYSIA